MDDRWKVAENSLNRIKISSNPNNEPVTIQGDSNDLRCVGIGTDAAVFQYIHEPSYAFKIYAKDKCSKIEVEASVYKTLGTSPYFSKCFATTETYLVLSFEEGITLYDCLLQGIHIPRQVVEDVDAARKYVREKSLNPRDIHLKNIFLQGGRAKIIDVSEYVQAGNDNRWEHLKKAYQEYYHLIDGKTVPYWLVETIRKWYNGRNKHTTFDDFMKNVLKLKLF
ncbi:serine/threonine protein kinase [Bacillus salitolerans]|uniref:Serine/threonine protein kinase n=1 Tax=Bacillus salitolerans TaxID=1437434 RepID=A0ABW4LPX4_9BACI